MDEFMQYATDKGMRRLGTISSARGRPLADIDIDYSPLSSGGHVRRRGREGPGRGLAPRSSWRADAESPKISPISAILRLLAGGR